MTNATNHAADAARESARRGNGEFGEQAKADPGNNLLTGGEPEPFVWDRSYHNLDQVKPYRAGYDAVYAELKAADKYPYNESFKGRIPGLAGSSNEDTGIYMLQVARDLDDDLAKRATFEAEGGVPVEDLDLAEGVEVRGTLVLCGQYSHGRGWQPVGPVRLQRRGNDWFFKQRGQRLARRFFGGKLMFKPDTKPGKATR